MRTIYAEIVWMWVLCFGLVIGCGTDGSGDDDVSSDDKDSSTVLEDTGSGEAEDTSHLVDTEFDTDTETTLEDADVGFMWVPIKGTGAGTFSMGNDASPLAEDKPAHEVSVADFEIAKTETTVTQWRMCMQYGGCAIPGTTSGSNPLSTNYLPFNEDYPINYITWTEAQTFCSWVGGRLPTAAEWEYAARSGGMYAEFPWGDDAASCSYAVMQEGSYDGCGETMDYPPRSVCSKTAGNTVFADLTEDQQLCDMVGNVYEFVEDCWHPNYNGAPTDGSAWVETPCTEMSMSGDDEQVVVRGGSYRHDALHQRATRQFGFGKNFQWKFYGFRCARDAQ